MANRACAEALRVFPLFPFASTIILTAGIAAAQQSEPAQEGLSLDLDVIAKQLDIARTEIQPSLGATVYNFGRLAIETQPQGDNQPFNRLFCRLPALPRIRSGSCTFAATMPICNSASTGFSCRRGSMSSARRCRRG